MPHSAVKCLVWRQFAWLSRAGARGESCGPTKNAHLYRDMARVPDTRVQIQTCGDTCLDIIDIYAPGTIMSRAAGGNKIGFNYYSCPIKIYRPIVSWQWLLWNLVWIMKHWLLLNSILMGVANIVGRISYKLLGRALSWMLKAGVRSIYSINLTSSYFSISFIGNSQICWCGKHSYDLDLYEHILIYEQTF